MSTLAPNLSHRSAATMRKQPKPPNSDHSLCHNGNAMLIAGIVAWGTQRTQDRDKSKSLAQVVAFRDEAIREARGNAKIVGLLDQLAEACKNAVLYRGSLSDMAMAQEEIYELAAKLGLKVR